MAACCVAFSLVSHATARAGGQADSGDTKVTAWLKAVNDHKPGEADAAVVQVASWSGSDLGDVLRQLKDLRDPKDPKGPSDPKARMSVAALNRVLERGALLHLDIATRGPRNSGASASTSVRFKDGHVVARVAETVHWEFARSLLDLVRPSPAKDDGARLWYRAAAACLEAVADYAALEPHLVRALQLFPDDPVLLLEAGTMHEAYAEPRIQHVIAEMAQGALLVVGRNGGNAASSADDQRALAEGLFRKAIAADPAFGEARIRLAHVLGEGDHAGEAAAELERVRALPLAPALQFDARLLAAEEDLALGRLDHGRTAADAAVALYPDARSARLVQSALRAEAGDREGALTALAPLSRATNARPADDPWLTYATRHVPDAEARLNDLSAALR
jgi:hypothetical protein